MFKYCSFGNLLSGLVLVLALATAAASAGVVLNVDSGTGKLLGASGISVNGGIYSVQFIEGTCANAYGACENGSFVTNDMFIANQFSDALLRDVFTGDFDNSPNLTFGCTGLGRCSAITAFQSVSEYVYASYAQNDVLEGLDASSSGGPPPGFNSANAPEATWARWTRDQGSNVPEPTTFALLAVAGAALTWSQRRRREVRVIQ